MGKIKIHTGRGTAVMLIDSYPQKWTGDEFRTIQKARKQKAANKTIETGRGTSSKKFGDMPDPTPRPSTEGMTRVTNRGTGSRKSKNKGSSS